MAIPPYMSKKISEYYNEQGDDENYKNQEESNFNAHLAHHHSVLGCTNFDTCQNLDQFDFEEEEVNPPTFPSCRLTEPYNMQKTEHFLKKDRENTEHPTQKSQHATANRQSFSSSCNHTEDDSYTLGGGEIATPNLSKDTSTITHEQEIASEDVSNDSSSDIESPKQNRNSTTHHKKEHKNTDHKKPK